jgi:hypothetical protein
MPEREWLVTALARDSEFAARLAEVGSSGAPLLVEAGGLLYRLEVHPAGGVAPTSGQARGSQCLDVFAGRVFRSTDRSRGRPRDPQAAG